jgi:predicted alpha/beta hydrolase
MDIKITCNERQVNCTVWDHPNSKKVLIIAPAMGVARRFYNAIALYFFNLSYSVISFDYYGMLDHKKIRKQTEIRLSDWGFKDIDSVIAHANKHFPGQELFFLGHSIAGQLFPLASTNVKIKAAFLVASQNVAKRNWRGFSKVKVNLFWNIIIPVCTVLFGYVPAFAYGGKHDLHKSIARDWAKWGNSKRGILGEVENASAYYRDLNVPTKFLSFSDDEMLAPLNAVKQLYESYGTPLKFHEHIIPEKIGMSSIGHFKFFKTECSFLWPKIEDWYGYESNFKAQNFKNLISRLPNPGHFEMQRQKLA